MALGVIDMDDSVQANTLKVKPISEERSEQPIRQSAVVGREEKQQRLQHTTFQFLLEPELSHHPRYRRAINLVNVRNLALALLLNLD